MAPQTLTLRNLAMPPEPLVLHLPHEVVCVAAGECGCSRSKSERIRRDSASGGKRVEAVNVRLPATITLLARGSKGDALRGLPAAVASAPEVAAAIASGKVKVLAETAAPEPAASAPEVQSEASPAEAAPDAAVESTAATKARRTAREVT